MKNKLMALLLIGFSMVFAQGTYYNGIDPNSPSFIATLSAKLIQRTNNSYTGFKSWAQENEAASNGKVYCVYTAQDVTTIFNREHTWCASWMPTNPADDSGFEYADYHNLLPTLIAANSARGNYPFGKVVTVGNYNVGGSKLGTDGNGKTVFEPRDPHKGDAARILLYMAVCYNGYQGSNWSIGNLSAGQNVDILLQWHQQDPPDAWEQAINEKVFAKQGNRNPFIDHPEWTNYINFTNLTYVPQNPAAEPTNYPTNFAAGTITDNSLQVNWTDAAAGTQAPSGYLIQLKSVNSFTLPTDGFPVSDDTDMADGSVSINIAYNNPDTYLFNNLSSGTNYYARIYSYNTNGGNINYKTDGTVPTLTSSTTGVANPASFSATPVSQTKINLNWQKNSYGDGVILAYSPTATFGIPQNGTAYNVGEPINGGGTVIYAGTGTIFSHDTLTAAKTYFYKVWSKNTANTYSGGLTKSATTTSGGGGTTEVISENFGNFTDSNSTDISGSLDTYTQTPGWTGTKIFPENGEAKLGSSSVQGTIITPTLNLSSGKGNTTLTFDLRKYGTDNSTIKVFHAANGTTFTQVGSDIAVPAETANQSVVITGGTASSKIKIAALSASACRFYLDNIVVKTNTTSILDENSQLKSSLLVSNYPNPFNPSTTISFNLNNNQEIKLTVYNVRGGRVHSQIKACAAGENSIKWDADNLPAGIYIYNIEADGHILSGKMSLIK